MSDLPRHPGCDGAVIDASLHLLDRTALDNEGLPVSVIDDLEIDFESKPQPVITSLVLSASIFGPLYRGHPPSFRLYRVPWRSVSDLGSGIRLAMERDDIETTWTERWLRSRLIGRIPGGRHAPE